MARSAAALQPEANSHDNRRARAAWLLPSGVNCRQLFPKSRAVRARCAPLLPPLAALSLLRASVASRGPLTESSLFKVRRSRAPLSLSLRRSSSTPLGFSSRRRCVFPRRASTGRELSFDPTSRARAFRQPRPSLTERTFNFDGSFQSSTREAAARALRSPAMDR